MLRIHQAFFAMAASIGLQGAAIAAPCAIGDQPPATIATLDINGISTITYQAMAFPVGYILLPLESWRICQR